MRKILVIGTGGLAREFTSWFKDNFKIVGYCSLNPTEHSQYGLPGVHFMGDDVTPALVGTSLAVLALGTPSIKYRLFKSYSGSGFSFPSIIHPSSEVSDLASLGEGVIVSPQCVISPNVTIKKLTYINFCCGIGHNATIGNYVQINPGAQLGGFSKIGDQVLIGSGSTVLERVIVGNEATVASGAVVFAKVADKATVMGNPAKRMPFLEKQ